MSEQQDNHNNGAGNDSVQSTAPSREANNFNYFMDYVFSLGDFSEMNLNMLSYPEVVADNDNFYEGDWLTPIPIDGTFNNYDLGFLPDLPFFRSDYNDGTSRFASENYYSSLAPSLEDIDLVFPDCEVIDKVQHLVCTCKDGVHVWEWKFGDYYYVDCMFYDTTAYVLSEMQVCCWASILGLSQNDVRNLLIPTLSQGSLSGWETLESDDGIVHFSWSSYYHDHWDRVKGKNKKSTRKRKCQFVTGPRKRPIQPIPCVPHSEERDDCGDIKDYATSKFSRKKDNENKDLKKQIADLRKRQAKLLKKKRVKVVKDGMTPHSGVKDSDEPIQYCEVIPPMVAPDFTGVDVEEYKPDPTGKVMSIVKRNIKKIRTPKIFREGDIMENLKSTSDQCSAISNSLFGERDKQDNMIAAFINLIGLFKSLSVAKTHKEIMIILEGWVLTKIRGDHVKWVRTQWSSMRPQSSEKEEGIFKRTAGCFSNLSITDIRLGLAKCRDMQSVLGDSPLVPFLKNAFFLVSYYQFNPNVEKKVEPGMLEYCMQQLDMNVELNFTSLSIFNAFADVAEFSLCCLEMVAGGRSVVDFIFPSSLERQFSEIQSLMLLVDGGSLKHVANMEEMTLKMKVSDMKMKVGSLLDKRAVPNQVYISYSGFYRALCTFDNQLAVRIGMNELREQPFALVIYGDPRIGKTFANQVFIDAWGSATGIPVTESKRFYWNHLDKFQSGYHNEKEVIVFDDLANAPIDPKNAQESAPAQMISIINNQPMRTNQADVAQKGQVFYKNRLVTATTNYPTIRAETISMDPDSIYDRLVFIHLRVMKKYQKDNSTALDTKKIPKSDMMVPVWEVAFYTYRSPRTVEKKIGDSMMPDTGKSRGRYFYPKRLEGKDLDGGNESNGWWFPYQCAMPELLLQATEHREQQLKVLTDQKKMSEAFHCRGCHMIAHENWCQCPEEHRALNWKQVATKPVEPHAALNVLYDTFFVPFFDDIMLNASYFGNRLSFFSINRKLENFVIYAFLKLIQIHVIGYMSYIKCKFAAKVMILVIIGSIISLGSIFCSKLDPCWWGCAVGVLIFTGVNFCLGARTHIDRRITAATMHAIIGEVSPMQFLVLFSGAAYCVQSFKQWASAMDLFSTIAPQGNLEPVSPEEISERRLEPDIWTNDFQTVTQKPLTINEKLATTQKNDRIEMMTSMMVKVESEKYVTHGYLISGTSVMVPFHWYKTMQDEKSITIVQPCVAGERNCKKCTTQIKKVTNLFPEYDFVIIEVVSSFGRSVGTRFLPDAMPQGHFSATVYSYNKDYSIKARKVKVAMMDRISNGMKSGFLTKFTAHGGRYPQVATDPFKNGDCMSPVVDDHTGCIIGFHAGGDSTSAVCYSLPTSALNLNYDMIFDTDKTSPHYGQVGMSGVLQSEDPLLTDICSGEFILPMDEELHPRSCVNFIPADVVKNVDVYGTCAKYRTKPTSRVKDHSYREALESVGIEHIWNPPQFKADRNHADYFQIFLQPMKEVDEESLNWAINDYLFDLLVEMNGFGDYGDMYFHPGPLTMDETLNGSESRFRKRIDIDTSPGFGLSQKKKDHLDITYVDGKRHVALKDHMNVEVNRVLEIYKQGKTSCPIVKSCCKDEPTVRKDICGKDKVRLFAVYPMSVFIIGKMYLLPILEFMYSFPILSEQLQGVNAFSDEWHQVREKVLNFSPDMVLEGDFSKMDVHMSGQYIQAMCTILTTLAFSLGYSREEVKIVNSIVQDLRYTIWLFNGTVFGADGWNKSGNYLTTSCNGFKISLSFRVIFYENFIKTGKLPKDTKFRSKVKVGSVGDDSIGSTIIPEFNMVLLAKEFEKYGDKFTSGTKGDVIDPFTTADECQFCKRKFRFEERVGKYVAPIDVKSIWRAIHCYTDKGAQPEEVFLQNLSMAYRNLAFHDESVFLHWTEKLNKFIFDNGLKDSVSCWKITYEEYWQEFKDTYFNPHPEVPYFYLDEKYKTEYDFSEMSPHFALRGWTCTQGNTNQIDKIGYHHESLKNLVGGSLISTLHNTPEVMIHAFGLNQIWITENHTVSVATSDQNVGVMEVSSTTPGWMSGFTGGIDKSMYQGSDSLSNDGFFSRPVKLFDLEWRVGQSLSFTFDPWTEFLTDPRIFNRLIHFKNLRGTMCVEFLVNGNKFYYGCCMCSYQPLPDDDTYTVIRDSLKADLVGASQRPHVLITPTESKGGVLRCPFIYPENYLDIPRANWGQMGNITVSTLNPLQHANLSDAPLVITVFAYMEDLSLNTPTSVKPSVMIPQSGEISHVAHTVANVSGKLANAPFIGKYMSAANVFSTAVGDIAQMFGFSRPTLQPSTMVVRRLFGLNAASNEFDTSRPLSLDSKKGITVDPRVCGFDGTDDMALIPLSCRESYLDTFAWLETDPINRMLFNMNITPMQGQTVPVAPPEVHLTPSGWTSMAFKYWTGSMCVRLMGVLSGVHSGRLLVRWDPDYMSGDLNYNTNYSVMLDVQGSFDETIRIGWGQTTNYLEVENPVPFINPLNHSTNAITSKNIYANGVLSVYVVNPLTSPSVEPTIAYINVYTRMCEDFELIQPRTDAIKWLQPKVFLPLPPSPDPTIVPTVLLSLEGALSLGNSSVSFDSSPWSGNPVITNYVSRSLIANGSYLLPSWGNNSYSPSFLFENPTSDPINGTITFGSGTPQPLVLPGLIGSQTTISPIIPEADMGLQFIPVTVDFTGTYRIWLVRGDLQVPEDTTQIMFGADGLRQFGVGFGGASGSPIATIATSAYIELDEPLANHPVTVMINSPCVINGTSFPGTQPASLDPYNNKFVWAYPVNGRITIQAIGSGPCGVSYIGYLSFPTMSPQSGEKDSEDSGNPDGESASHSMAPPCPSGTNQIYFGEQVGSWRQLLKRYHYTGFVASQNANVSAIVSSDPVSFPSQGNGNNRTGKVLSIYDYVTPAYVGQRGSYRVRFGNLPTYMCASQVTDINGASITTSGYNLATWMDFDMSAGSEFYHTATNHELFDVEIPWYNKYRFRKCRTTNYNGHGKPQYYRLKYGTAGATGAYVLTSIGEDFSLVGFVSVPVYTNI